MTATSITSLKNKLNTSTWHLVLLCIPTGGIYLLMWLYKHQETLMAEVGQRFSSRMLVIWMAVCTGLATSLKTMFPLQVDDYGYSVNDGAATMQGIALLLTLAYIVLLIVWAFKARAALQQYALTQFRFDLKMNAAWTVLFHVFYINYCINAMPEAMAKHQIIHGKPQPDQVTEPAPE
ncbi:TPA: DUF4234 domain-containing protein [Enterobacter hormaechei subsp. xiangfangensis]|nr:DUF4234 domain-containing protein [Enterobacter hormaechei subsp. xiangfangensis]